jgi:acetylornithine deacetylase/succinyl-diaminopimelate desuccinylase-like protein
VADGKTYGRGTLDDKQGVIGLLEAAEQLLAENFQPGRTIVFAFGHDEEIGGGRAQPLSRSAWRSWIYILSGWWMRAA